MTAAVDDLRFLAALALEYGGARGATLARRIGDYMAGARDGVKLDQALGLSPGLGETPWWTAELRAQRDALLVEIAERFFANESSVRRRAAGIMRRIARYEAGAWQRDKLWKSAPEQYDGKLEALLFALLKLRLPLSVRTVQRTLAAARVPNGSVLIGIGHSPNLGHEEHSSTHP